MKVSVQPKVRTPKSLFIGSKFIGHDAAIFVILPDEKEVFAISNERLTRYKHDDLYPLPALQKLISYLGIDVDQVERLYFANSFVCQATQSFAAARYELSVATRKFFGARYLSDYVKAEAQFQALSQGERLARLETNEYGRILSASIRNMDTGGAKDEVLDNTIRRHLSSLFPKAEVRVSYFDHQLCHAASSMLATPFEETLLLTFDGYGDGSYSKAYLAKNGALSEVANCLYQEINLKSAATSSYSEGMGSPGGIYHYFTFLLGFQPDADEGKVEALAAFGKPEATLLAELFALFSINADTRSLVFDAQRAEEVLNYARMRDLMTRVSREDLSATVQTFLETLLLEYCAYLLKVTGAKSISLSGGVAANVIANLRIFEEGTAQLHITPAMGDDGTAQGAAILQLLSNGYAYNDLKWLKEKQLPYFGTSYSREEVLRRVKASYSNVLVEDYGDRWPEAAAQLLVNGEIGAIFHGRMEWGPRALGNRSIIADARRADMRELINKEIKRRPLFQPFCPSMLAEEKERLFEKAYLNKHMTCAFRMKEEFVKDLPSAVHVDNTARVQFVEEKDNPMYYRLLKKVKELTGYGVIINTSFNRHGRTIVESPEDAVQDFLDTDLGFLMIEGYLVRRAK